jgi:hypothetical protein
MKKRKIFFTFFTCYFLLLLVTPVFAAPARQVPFTGEQTPKLPLPLPGEDYRMWTTEGGTIHIRNSPGGGTIILMFNDQTLEGVTSANIDANVIVNVGGPVKFAMTWTFDDGTFVGNIIGKALTVQTYGDLHGVLQGTGAYEGWTVILEGNKPVPGATPFYWTGTIVIR